MPSFGDALRAVNTLKDEQLIEAYAIAGAMALVFWTEPVPTYDLDVLVVLPPSDRPLVSLEPLYRWAAGRGYTVRDEHVIIEGVPTQFLPSPNALSDEAIASADVLDYEGIPVRVVRPEHLIALYLVPSARTRKRRERAAALLEWSGLNRALLDEILARHGLAF
jgi:hypothetical protein